MNGMSNTVKAKFAGLLRGLLRHFEASEADAPPDAQPFATTASAAAPRPQPESMSIPAAPPNRAVNELEMPLQPILEKLPAELRARMIMSPADLGQASISIPIEQILPQLALGSVKIMFGQLREAALNLFRVGEEYDSLPVVLPLNAVLSRLSPGLLSRNPAQKAAGVPAEITGPFGARTQSPAAFPAPAKSPAPAAPPFRMAAPVQKTDTQIKPRISPAPVAPRKETPMTPVIPATMVRPIAPAAPTPVAPEQKIISAPLAALSGKWPEALRREITQRNLADAHVALPLDAVAQAMKRGRVTFVWRDLRSWIRPTPAAAVSVHDKAELELPLKVIAPLFMERHAPPARPQTRLTFDKSIPNLFFGFPSAETEAPVAAPAAEPVPESGRPALKPVDAKLSETNYYVWGDAADTPRVDASEYKRAQAPATDFTSRYATPKEIVARSMTLPGVTGAVVALNDGLMIASQVPPDLNADTVAAFLPQIFDRMAQCTRELRMGALNNLKFTVGNVPWHIFRVNAVYFAAFGRAGESLPTAQLKSLAGELDRKKQ